jgi:hypothetical protein
MQPIAIKIITPIFSVPNNLYLQFLFLFEKCDAAKLQANGVLLCNRLQTNNCLTKMVKMICYADDT